MTTLLGQYTLFYLDRIRIIQTEVTQLSPRRVSHVDFDISIQSILCIFSRHSKILSQKLMGI